MIAVLLSFALIYECAINHHSSRILSAASEAALPSSFSYQQYNRWNQGVRGITAEDFREACREADHVAVGIFPHYDPQNKERVHITHFKVDEIGGFDTIAEFNCLGTHNTNSPQIAEHIIDTFLKEGWEEDVEHKTNEDGIVTRHFDQFDVSETQPPSPQRKKFPLSASPRADASPPASSLPATSALASA